MKFCIIFITAFLCFIFSTESVAQLTTTQRQDLPFKNLIVNPEFENGKAGWTVTGGDTFSATSTTVKRELGTRYLTWDSAGADRRLYHTAITVDDQIAGANGLCEYRIKVPSGSATHLVRVYDGTNVLVSQTITNNSSVAETTSVTFNFPTSGTVYCELISVAADEPSINIYSAYFGRNYRLGTSGQATFWGSQTIAGKASCYFTGTNSTSYNNYAADSDCNTPTLTGYATTTAGKKPAISFASLPPGRYEFKAQFVGDVSAVDIGCAYRFSDGTNTTNGVYSSPPGSAGNAVNARTVIGFITYNSTKSAPTIELQASTVTGSGTCDITDTQTPVGIEITVYRYPLESETTYSTDVLPASWQGKHQDNCSFPRTNTALGDPTSDATCTFTEQVNNNFATVSSYSSAGNNLPGITFTPKKTGRFLVKASFGVESASTGVCAVRLTDGTSVIDENAVESTSSNDTKPMTLIGLLNITSATSTTIKLQTACSTSSVTIQDSGGAVDAAIQWSIIALDQSFPAANFTGNVTNTGSGSLRIISAKLNCDSASAITSQSNGSSSISSIGNISSGSCAVTLASSTFSETPVCIGNLVGSNRYFSVTASSSTSVSMSCANTDTSACGSFDAYLICMGAK